LETVADKELWETTQQIAAIGSDIKLRKWKWIGCTLRTRITLLDRDLTGTHREKEG
jgi:hypothetical protein